MTSGDYGRLSLFRDPASLVGERARELAFRNLEARGKSPDEVSARAEYLDLLGLQPGQRVLDVGCGSGVVTRDMARRVSPGGRAVGVDPSAEFVTIATELARADGLADVTDFREGSALALPFQDAEFHVAIAATVLVHVPGGDAAVPEMARVVRVGGRVGIFDFDGDSLLISHPDRALTRRIVAAFSDHAAVDGWLVRRLPGLLRRAGLAHVETRAFLPPRAGAGRILWPHGRARRRRRGSEWGDHGGRTRAMARPAPRRAGRRQLPRWSCPRVLLGCQAVSALGARLYETVQEYASIGAHHRTGTAEDARTLDWFEDRIRALGARTERQTWSFDRFDAEGSVSVDGTNVEALPLFYEGTGEIEIGDAAGRRGQRHPGRRVR